MREKERRDNVSTFYHTCASKQHHNIHDRESLVLSLSYTSGNFSLQNLACIFQQWASSSALGLLEQASWMHTHLVSFVELLCIYSSSASIAWQSLLLALTSIGGHLHSPLISLVDVRLSPFLSSPHKPPSLYSIPPIVLYPWLTLMYCVKVEKSLRLLNYETIAWLAIRVVHDESIFV